MCTSYNSTCEMKKMFFLSPGQSKEHCFWQVRLWKVLKPIWVYLLFLDYIYKMKKTNKKTTRKVKRNKKKKFIHTPCADFLS